MTKSNETIALTTPGQINMYAFLMIRRALSLRVKHGIQMLRGQEILAARNNGFTTAKTASKALADMNKIAVKLGFGGNLMDVSTLPYIVRLAAISGLKDYIRSEAYMIREFPDDRQNNIRRENIEYYRELIRQLTP